MHTRSDGRSVIEAVDYAGRRTPVELCDTEQEAQARALQLADAAPRIQARIDGAGGPERPVRLSMSRAERLAEYPRISVTIPPTMRDWLAEECQRRHVGLSQLVQQIIGERMLRGMTIVGDGDC